MFVFTGPAKWLRMVRAYGFSGDLMKVQNIHDFMHFRSESRNDVALYLSLKV